MLIFGYRGKRTSLFDFLPRGFFLVTLSVFKFCSADGM